MSDVSSESPTTSRIVSQGRAADRSVLAKLLEEFRPSLRTEARAGLGANLRLRKRQDESDITQMTLLTAVEEFTAFRGETDAQLRAWLRAIQQQHIAAAARRENAAKRDAQREINASADSSAAKVEPIESGCRPSRRMQLKELRDQIDRALEDLPESQRCVIRMRFMDEFSTQQIVELTGQSERAVAGLLRRGMTRLKDVLAGQQ